MGGWTVKILDDHNKVVASGHVVILADVHVPLVLDIK